MAALQLFNYLVVGLVGCSVGRPELLKFLGSGVWSLRITQEHRLVYAVGHERIDFIQARYHY
ncbi:MAG: type II toxin-antitoxin system YoeB family toxin [Desulfatitalea sp.]|nr:type II toxin-antitoxin system YoeB family toxin [Desulfatitalea sp.]